MSQPPRSPPTAVVVVVTYNNVRDVTDCLATLLANTVKTAISVVVVDNASTDGTRELARRTAAADERVVLVENNRNVGFGAACNQGARTGAGDFVVLLNPDTQTHPGAIDALVEMAARPGIGPVAGRTVDEHGRLDPLSAQNAPSLAETAAWAMASSVWARTLPGEVGRRLARSRSLLPLRTFEQEGPVPVVIGCLLALRRSEWDALGGFDERFFMYGEDVDLSLRARTRGLTPSYTPAATITHFVGASSPSQAAKLVLSLSGRVTIMRHHWPPVRAAAGRRLLVGGVGVRALGEQVRHRPGAWTETWRRRGEWSSGYADAERGGSAAPAAAPVA